MSVTRIVRALCIQSANVDHDADEEDEDVHDASSKLGVDIYPRPSKKLFFI